MTVAFALLTAILAAILTGADVSGSPWRRPLKMAASTGFLAVAVSAGATASTFGRFVLAALVLSWIGDLLLTYEDRRAFTAGLAAFLLAHVGYSVAFGTLGVSASVTGVAAVAVAIMAGFVWRLLAPHVGDMGGPVAAYVAVISVMTLMAYGAFGAGAPRTIPVGATLFALSDLFVARERFVTSDPRNSLRGLPLYYGAQILLALSVAR